MSKIVEFFKKIFTKNEDHKHLIESVIIAEDCMISRTNIPVVYIDSTPKEVKKVFNESQSKHIIVCEDNLDEIKGVMSIFDYKEDKPLTQQKMTDPIFITFNTELSAIFQEVLNGNALHVVIDEFGGTKGIVTLESIMNFLFIESINFSEKDTEFNVPGNMTLNQLESKINIVFDEHIEAKTVGGFILEHLGKIPNLNETFSIGNYSFKVTGIKNRQIYAVQIKKIKV